MILACPSQFENHNKMFKAQRWMRIVLVILSFRLLVTQRVLEASYDIVHVDTRQMTYDMIQCVPSRFVYEKLFQGVI